MIFSKRPLSATDMSKASSRTVRWRASAWRVLSVRPFVRQTLPHRWIDRQAGNFPPHSGMHGGGCRSRVPAARASTDCRTMRAPELFSDARRVLRCSAGRPGGHRIAHPWPTGGRAAHGVVDPGRHARRTFRCWSGSFWKTPPGAWPAIRCCGRLRAMRGQGWSRRSPPPFWARDTGPGTRGSLPRPEANWSGRPIRFGSPCRRSMRAGGEVAGSDRGQRDRA